MSASNTYVDKTAPADYISDAQYLKVINSGSESLAQKCCIKRVLDDTKKSSLCQNDAKLFTVSELALRSPQDPCIHSTLVSMSPDTLSSEFHRPPIA